MASFHPTQAEKIAFLAVFSEVILAEEPADPRFKGAHTEFAAIIGEVVAKPTKAAVNSLFSDLSEMCREGSRQERALVSAALQQKIGRSLAYFEGARLARIDRIIARGKIRTDDEWRLIDARICELCEEPVSPDPTEVLDRLLSEYKPRLEE